MYMKKKSEGRKMFITVMSIFIVYAAVFIIFDDFDRNKLLQLDDVAERHLLAFAVIVVVILGFLLHHYALRMDARIRREQTKKEKLTRRQMTQNISHELKTPVASILGYTETIINNPDIDEPTRLQFIKRCHKQAQRLTMLLQDISTLNRIDYAAEIIEMTPINVSEIIKEVVQETSFALEEQQMTLTNNVPDNIIVNGNAPLLYSIFHNLADNSIKYSGKNTSITISATEQNNYWKFTFSDNGNGIPQSALPKIFERFYRIDKGRSRTMGGTGLGLAIVKNAIMLHGGKISASSNNGLQFDFTLKK